MNDFDEPYNERDQEAACPETGGENSERLSDVLLEPVGHGHHGNNGGTSSGAKTEEHGGAIEHNKRLGVAKKNESEADADYAAEDKPPGTESINEESCQRGKNPHFQTPQAGREGNLGITPTELLDQGVDEGREAEKENTAYIQADGKAGQDDPPAVKNSAHNSSKSKVCKWTEVLNFYNDQNRLFPLG